METIQVNDGRLARVTIGAVFSLVLSFALLRCGTGEVTGIEPGDLATSSAEDEALGCHHGQHRVGNKCECTGGTKLRDGYCRCPSSIPSLVKGVCEKKSSKPANGGGGSSGSSGGSNSPPPSPKTCTGFIDCSQFTYKDDCITAGCSVVIESYSYSLCTASSNMCLCGEGTPCSDCYSAATDACGKMGDMIPGGICFGSGTSTGLSFTCNTWQCTAEQGDDIACSDNNGCALGYKGCK